MENQIFESLNSEQAVALKQIEGAVLVTAGAGSGKTRLLTHRIVHLIENLGVSPYNVLAITFTNKAAGEMKERILNMTPKGQDVWISTFHSMCVRILRQHISSLDARFNKNFSIYADAETDKVLKTLITEEGIEDKDFKKKISFHLSNMKNNNIPLQNYKETLALEHNGPLIAKIMANYQKVLTENNALDFDDLLVKTYELFDSHHEILNHYAERFSYILVDEFQDTNTLQYDLVKMLASVHGNVFAVGDEDQCIYTWRGANFANISNFTKDFKGVKVFKLERNYRSTKTILNAANKLIKNNRQRIDKTLWCDSAEGEPIEYKVVYDEQNEADFIARTIHNLVHQKGYSYSDFAILLRLNALSLQFEKTFLNYNIPHIIYGGFKFFERAEIKDVLAYLTLFTNPKDDQAFLRIINSPKRGIGDSSIAKIKDVANKQNLSLLQVTLKCNKYLIDPQVCKKMDAFLTPFNNLKRILQEDTLSLKDFCDKVVKNFKIKEQYTQANLDKVQNIEQLIASIGNEEELLKKDALLTNAYLIDKLSDYLHKVTLFTDMNTESIESNVIISTVHAVKGLEFRVVFLPALEEGIFPIARAEGNENDMEEERRLMYVAMTRAKETLFISTCRTRYLYYDRKYMIESRFIADAGLSRKITSQNPFTISPFGETSFEATSPKTFGGFKGQVDAIKDYAAAPTLASACPLKFKVGQIVQHTRFGRGRVLEVDHEERTGDIDFENFGVKTLMLDIAPLEIIEGD